MDPKHDNQNAGSKNRKKKIRKLKIPKKVGLF